MRRLISSFQSTDSVVVPYNYIYSLANENPREFYYFLIKEQNGTKDPGGMMDALQQNRVPQRYGLHDIIIMNQENSHPRGALSNVKWR